MNLAIPMKAVRTMAADVTLPNTLCVFLNIFGSDGMRMPRKAVLTSSIKVTTPAMECGEPKCG